MEIILAQPRGVCAGVQRAIAIVERAIDKYGPPIYVRHEIVHNKYVVEQLKNKGVIFVDEISEIPVGAITIFSAHGVSNKVEKEAKERKLPTIDATCPLVTKVHKEAQRHEIEGMQLILIGHPGHPEVEGTSGKIKGKMIIVSNEADIENIKILNPDNLAYVTQTTLSLDDTKNIINKLKAKFPNIKGPETKDICYATQNRQNAVRELSKLVDIILVIGAKNSSNSNRLVDLAKSMHIDAYLINNEMDLQDKWFANINKIGITAGASAPEILVQNVVKYISEKYAATVKTMSGIVENVVFNIPKELR